MDSVLADMDIDDEPATVMPPVDADMTDILPLSNRKAKDVDEKAKKLAKEERKLLKKAEKKRAALASNDVEMTDAGNGQKTILDVEPQKEKEKEKKTKRKHQHDENGTKEKTKKKKKLAVDD